MNYYSFKIPEPCHEDWNEMSPAAKGRFCSSCATTVIDFTKMTPQEIHDYMQSQKGKRVCGRMKQQEPEKLVIQIPSVVLQRSRSPYRAFACSLLIAMGTTLLSCNSGNGNKQKIDAVEVVDTTAVEKLDSLIQETNKDISREKDSVLDHIPVVVGMIEPPIPPGITGIMVSEEDDKSVFQTTLVDQFPKFPNATKNLNNLQSKQYFEDGLKQFVQTNFNTQVADSSLSGLIKITVMFAIDKNGKVIDVQCKAPSFALKKETLRVINSLPEFEPALTKKKKSIDMTYALPIRFEIY